MLCDHSNCHKMLISLRPLARLCHVIWSQETADSQGTPAGAGREDRHRRREVEGAGLRGRNNPDSELGKGSSLQKQHTLAKVQLLNAEPWIREC